jgi:hypothetical protein
MTETPLDMGMVAAPPSTSPPPAPTATPQLRPSAPPNPRSIGHSPARDRYAEMRSGTDGAPAAAEAGANAPQTEAPSTSGDKFKVGKFEISETEIGELMADKAQRDLAAATRPATPDAYELKLPEGTTLPGNVAVQFDANDPGMVAARNWAHARGIDQQGFSEVLAIYASHVAQQEATLAERSRAEIAKAGANGPARVDAVTQWITALVGEADAKPIRATLVTDAHLRFYEKLMTQHTSQGTAPFSQQHRVAPETGKIPGFENMSFEQRRHAQEQLAARRR